MDAHNTDVRPPLREAGRGMGVEPDPISAHRASLHQAAERKDGRQAGWGA